MEHIRIANLKYMRKHNFGALDEKLPMFKQIIHRGQVHVCGFGKYNTNMKRTKQWNNEVNKKITITEGQLGKMLAIKDRKEICT